MAMLTGNAMAPISKDATVARSCQTCAGLALHAPLERLVRSMADHLPDDRTHDRGATEQRHRRQSRVARCGIGGGLARAWRACS